MKTRCSGLLAFLLLAGVAGGCARRPASPPPPPPPQPAERENLIVLLAEADGSVGQVDVSNPSGTQSLTRAREAVEVNPSSGALDAPFEIDQSEIDQIFGRVLQELPEPPARFILYFVSGSALTDEMKRTLEEVFKTIQDRRSVDVSVIGHSDTSGANDVNQRVSARRARVVADQLIALGVDPANIEVGSHGEDNLLVPTADNVVEPRNRRVEITVR